MVVSPTWNVMVDAGVALAGILAVLHSCLDLKATIGGSQYHNILYFLTPAMKPRMLMTVDKDMNLLPVSVRVGQAVDVVAQVRGPHLSLVIVWQSFKVIIGGLWCVDGFAQVGIVQLQAAQATMQACSRAIVGGCLKVSACQKRLCASYALNYHAP